MEEVRANDVPGKHSRVTGFARGDRPWLGAEDVPTVGLEWWSSVNEEEMRLVDYAVIRLDPAYARRIANQLLEMADHAEGS